MKEHIYPEGHRIYTMEQTTRQFELGNATQLRQCVKLCDLAMRVCCKLEEIGKRHEYDEDNGTLFRAMMDVGYYGRHSITRSEDAIDAAREVAGK